MTDREKFYELQEWAGGIAKWNHIAFFKTRKAADKHGKEFNVGVEVATIRVIEREFTE